MPLNKADLKTDLQAVFEGYPGTREQAANEIGDAYDAYAATAQSCAGLTPTLVNLAPLKSQLKTAFETGGTPATVADAVAAAFEAYWTGALFGATGAVVTVGGTSALSSGLAALWAAQAATLATFSSSAQAHADLLDTFTKTVNVTDTAVPSPSGCGPAPIS